MSVTGTAYEEAQPEAADHGGPLPDRSTGVGPRVALSIAGLSILLELALDRGFRVEARCSLSVGVAVGACMWWIMRRAGT